MTLEGDQGRCAIRVQDAGWVFAVARTIIEGRRTERPVNSLASAGDMVESKVVVAAARSEVARSTSICAAVIAPSHLRSIEAMMWWCCA